MKNFEKIGFILTIPYEPMIVRLNVEKITPIPYEHANVQRNVKRDTTNIWRNVENITDQIYFEHTNVRRKFKKIRLSRHCQTY